MSAWSDARAMAYAVPAEKLREHYEEACFALALIACGVDGRVEAFTDVDIAALPARVEELRKERDAAEEEKIEAEGRLEEKLQAEDAEGDELEVLRRENEELQARLEKVKPLLDAYADCLAVCRRFVGAAEEAKIPVKHCRIVSSSKSAGRRGR